MSKRLDIKYQKVGDLIPYENNPRFNDVAVDYVAKSIEEFGFKNPVIVDKNNVIIAGHTRQKAAEQLGIEEVPTLLADDLTPDQVKAFRLADNKTSEFSEWDFESLLAEMRDVDMSLVDFGFDEIPDMPDFQPVEEDSQPRLDELNPKIVKCPHCGGEFDVRQQA